MPVNSFTSGTRSTALLTSRLFEKLRQVVCRYGNVVSAAGAAIGKATSYERIGAQADSQTRARLYHVQRSRAGLVEQQLSAAVQRAGQPRPVAELGEWVSLSGGPPDAWKDASEFDDDSSDTELSAGAADGPPEPPAPMAPMNPDGPWRPLTMAEAEVLLLRAAADAAARPPPRPTTIEELVGQVRISQR